MKSALGSLLMLLLLTGCRPVQQEMFLADARINDQPARFAYDTGAGITLIHDKAARRLGVRYSKPPAAEKALPGKVKIGETDLCRVTVNSETHTFKLATVHLPWPWGTLLGLDGVIGWPDLHDDYISIDAMHDAIDGVEHLPQDTNGWVTLRLYQRTDVLALEIPRADGKTGVLELDTGNSEGISLPASCYKKWRASHPHAHKRWNLTYMPGSGPGIGRSYMAEDLSVGPLIWRHVNLRKATLTETSIAASGDVFEASIGIAAMRQLNVIIDRTNHLAYLRRSPDWNLTLEANRPKVPHRAASSTNSTVRLNFQEHEYADLATAAFDAGKFDEAITNLTRLLDLEPDNAEALAVRGRASLRLHTADGSATNLDLSLRDFNRALELDSGITHAYEGRAGIYYLTQRWDQALKDYRFFCEKAPAAANYQRFFMWLIRTRQGEQVAADKELAAWFGPGTKAKASRWERNIARFLLGQMSETEFLAAAGKDAGRQCEAWFYAGMKQLIAGDATRAPDYFQKCLATNMKDYEEYNFASAELRMAKIARGSSLLR